MLWFVGAQYPVGHSFLSMIHSSSQAVAKETGTDSRPRSSAKRRVGVEVAGEDGLSWDRWALSPGSTSATFLWTEVIYWILIGSLGIGL